MEKSSRKVVKKTPKVVSINTRASMFRGKNYPIPSSESSVWENIDNKTLREERASLAEEFFYFRFSQAMFFWDHSLPTKTLSWMRKCHNTRISSCDIMVSWFSSYILIAVRIAHSENMTSLSTSSSEHFLSINAILASEKSMNTKSFSFFERTEHILREKNNVEIVWKKGNMSKKKGLESVSRTVDISISAQCVLDSIHEKSSRDWFIQPFV